VLGSLGGCCGLDYGSPGCGKCLLIQNPESVHADWTAVVMKKSRCPPWTKGCGGWTSHFDLAVPGFDNLLESTANVCSEREGTLFEDKSESGVLGDWFRRSTFNKTGQCTTGCSTAERSNVDRCKWLPPEFAKGCQLFAEWGWTMSPKNVRYRRVECPQKFVDWVESAYGPPGILHSDTKPTSTTTTTSTSTTSTTTNTTTTSTILTLTTSTAASTTSSSFLTSTTQLTLAVGQPEDEAFLSGIAVPMGIASAVLVFSCVVVFCVRCFDFQRMCCPKKRPSGRHNTPPKRDGTHHTPEAVHTPKALFAAKAPKAPKACHHTQHGPHRAEGEFAL